MLTLSPAGEDRFEGAAPADLGNNTGSIFGGLLFGQALNAAKATTDRPLHMMSGRFMRGGTPGESVTYEVSNAKDGRSFSARHVTASQNGLLLAQFDASCHSPEDGMEFQEGWAIRPPDPETLPTLAQAAEGFAHLPPSALRALNRPRGLELRPVEADSLLTPQTRKPTRIWVRVSSPMAQRPDLWAPAIGYLVDAMMAGPGIAQHTFVLNPEFYGATLNHTLWLHSPTDPSQWLLHEIACHWTGGGRTMNMSRLYTREGRLVATNAQEALLRRRSPKPQGLAR